ncbi:MAG: site-2 protease family protein [Candidatus Nomurabacteria bacterium]|jgi:regulator of sigma E protease|nr:site-2 protease family protein [Candidatus Nomurabacteria bacterium]
MELIFGIIVGLVVLMLLVLVHELGHFIVARRNGVEVTEFAIGFPPRAVAWRKVNGKWCRLKKSEWENPPSKDYVVSLNWLPIGGFCQMKDESDAATRKGSFGRASFWQKTKILFGGVTMNLIFAAVILTILAFTGMPHFIEGQFEVPSDTNISAAPVLVGEVEPSSPAEVAGLQSGDELKTMKIEECVVQDCHPQIKDEVEIVTPQDVTSFDAKYAGHHIELIYIRDGKEHSASVALNESGGDYILGVIMNQTSMPIYRSTWSAPIVGVATTVQLTGETFRGLGEMVWNLVSGAVMQVNIDSSVREEGAANIEKAGQAVSGPVGIIGVLFPAFAQTGLTNVAFLAAIISVSLACMNILPIPALDGGRWLLIAIYRLRKKKLTKATEEKIVSRAFMVLIGLIILITVLDVMRLF